VVRTRRIVDRGVKVLTSNPRASWDEIRPRLIDVMKSEPTPYLTDQEMDSLRRYMDRPRGKVQPIIDRLNTTRTKATAALTSERCTVYCVIFWVLECNTDCLVGSCFGAWDCGDGITLPDCDECVEEEDSPCTSDEDCDDGYRCAKWVFKANECVKTCEDDSDCPAGQEFKRPFGTRYRRYK
jgi:hypothetical protein